MGETGFCKDLRLRFPAKICGFLRKSATPKSLDLQSEPKISENLRKCAFRVRFLPFAVSLLARPDKNPMETAPRNRRFLALVVVECVLSLLNA